MDPLLPSTPTRRRFLAAAALLPAGLLLPGCRDDGSSGGAAASARSDGHAPGDLSGLPPRVVGLRSLGGAFVFDPAGLLVERGSEVHWLNMGDFHTTTAFHPDYDDLLSDGVPLRIPEGAEPWHSGTLGLTAGTQFTHSFRVEGVHDYFCQPHYSFGMVGRVVVGKPRGGPAVTTDLPSTPEAVRRNMPTVEEITGPAGVTYEWASRINGVLYRAANGDDPAPFARAVAEAMAEHRALRARAASAADSLDERVGAFRAGAEEGIGYEELVRRADAAKDVLQTIHSRG